MKKVEIEKRFKGNLRERFDETNAVLENGCYRIRILCILCETYHTKIKIEGCGKCPFQCFKVPSESAEGCVVFIRNIMKTKNERSPIIMNRYVVMWCASEDKEARDFLKFIREKAKKAIRFV